MRILCLLFPRLGIQLIRRRDPGALGRPVITLAGSGDEARVSGLSAEATAAGVEPGMLASVARGRCPSAMFLPDNAGECLDALERIASILRTRATPGVVVGGRDHVFVDLDGVTGRFGDEVAVAERLRELARGWSGLEVRAGVAGSRERALCAASKARRFVVIAADDAEAADVRSFSVAVDPELSANFEFGSAQPAGAVRARIGRLLGTLQPLLEGRGESFREIAIELTHGSGAAATVRLQLTNPLARTGEALVALSPRLPDGVLEGVSALRLCLGRLGPDVSVRPGGRASVVPRVMVAPVKPVQRRLLRAS
jgi:hypothetical protein